MTKSKATILCVENDGLKLDALKQLLEDSGHDVLTAESAREGLALFGSQVIDAVIVDYQMLGMNGDRMASQMKRIKPSVPILMLSATEVARDKLASVDAFLCNGESWPAILAALEQILQARLLSFDRWWETWKHQASLSPERS